jgi:hypothetical protein
VQQEREYHPVNDVLVVGQAQRPGPDKHPPVVAHGDEDQLQRGAQTSSGRDPFDERASDAPSRFEQRLLAERDVDAERHEQDREREQLPRLRAQPRDGPHEEPEKRREDRQHGGALAAQQRQEIQDRKTAESEHRAAPCESPSHEKRAQNADGGENLGSVEDRVHGLGVNGMHAKCEARGQSGRAWYAEGREPVEQKERRQEMQRDVGQVVTPGVVAVDRSVERQARHREWAIQSTLLDASTCVLAEELRDRAHPAECGVVPDDDLVVVQQHGGGGVEVRKHRHEPQDHGRQQTVPRHDLRPDAGGCG